MLNDLAFNTQIVTMRIIAKYTTLRLRLALAV